MKRIWKKSETSESGETGWLILAKAGEVGKKSEMGDQIVAKALHSDLGNPTCL